MRQTNCFLVVLCVFCLTGIPCLAQSNSLSSAFHLSSEASYLGATLSHDLAGINRDKVKLRGTFSYLSGGYESLGSGSQSAERFELGLETKNTMVRGKSPFSVIDLAYSFGRSDRPGSSYGANGLMFAMGFGSRVASSVSVLGKYVLGRDQGVRLAMEVDF